MIAIIDYGVGNLFSIRRSLSYLGVDSVISRDEHLIRGADKLILPGVGAFGDAMDKFISSGVRDIVLGRAGDGVPLLGICLGMQLLFDVSYEYGRHPGLSLIPGEIIPLRGAVPEAYKVPQIGWNGLSIKRPSPLTKDIKEGDCVYYVHSFYADTAAENVIAASEYGVTVPGIVGNGNVYGCQFHPEKSGGVGLKILSAFAELEAL